MHNLHPGARWTFRLNAYSRFSIIAFILGYFIIRFLSDSKTYKTFTIVFGSSFFSGLLLFLLIFIIFVLIIGEIYARMAYNRWFYEFNDDGLRLERGVVWKRYSNVPYERIQNVDVHRGIIARILGFSTIEIQTAGYSAYYGGRGMHSEGHIPAVSIHEAEQIRQFVMKHVSHKKSGI